ncbi:MAG: flagellar basal-body rod protein FlgG [Bacillota bacterium]
MIRGLTNAASGMNAQAAAIDIIANNIANVNTIGKKNPRPGFAELIHQTLEQYGLPIEGGTATPPRVGNGSRLSSNMVVFTPGEITETGRAYDLAIAGKGLFQVELPDGGKALTRDGAFEINEKGELITANGYRLFPSITMPEGHKDIRIEAGGNVFAVDAAGASTPVGRITLVNVTNPSGLKPLGANLLEITENSGPPAVGNPGEEGLGSLRQGFLEVSNVDMAEEMTSLLIAQRAYEVNSKAVQTADEMWAMANNLRK